MKAHALKVKRRKAIARNLVLGVLVIVFGPYAYNYLGAFVAGDPFVGLYKKSKKAIDPTIGIRMDAVELRDYNGAKLVSSAYANRVDVREDRQAATLYGVKNGTYNGENGQSHYSAITAVWNFQTKQVLINKGVNVQNKDLDLKAKSLIFDDKTGMLRVNGDVSGKLYKGDVVASTVLYNMKTGAGDTGPVEWSGVAEVSPQDDDSGKPRKWDIKSSHMKSLGSKTDTYLYENATATDGDLILVAPRVLQNRKTDVLTADGGIEYYSGKANIKADKCVVYRKEKRAILSGHVFMYVKPKAQEDDPPKIEKLPEFKPVTPDQVVATQGTKPLTPEEQKTKEDEIRSSKNLRDFPLIVVSDQIEYWYGKGSRHAVITGAPQGRQSMHDAEWRHLWSYSAFYDGELETLKLMSAEKQKQALMKNSLGDKMRYDWLQVSTKEDDDSVEGGEGDGTIYSSEEIPKDEKKKSDVPPVKVTKTGGG